MDERQAEAIRRMEEEIKRKLKRVVADTHKLDLPSPRSAKSEHKTVHEDTRLMKDDIKRKLRQVDADVQSKLVEVPSAAVKWWAHAAEKVPSPKPDSVLFPALIKKQSTARFGDKLDDIKEEEHEAIPPVIVHKSKSAGIVPSDNAPKTGALEGLRRFFSAAFRSKSKDQLPPMTEIKIPEKKKHAPVTVKPAPITVIPVMPKEEPEKFSLSEEANRKMTRYFSLMDQDKSGNLERIHYGDALRVAGAAPTSKQMADLPPTCTITDLRQWISDNPESVGFKTNRDRIFETDSMSTLMDMSFTGSITHMRLLEILSSGPTGLSVTEATELVHDPHGLFTSENRNDIDIERFLRMLRS